MATIESRQRRWSPEQSPMSCYDSPGLKALIKAVASSIGAMLVYWQCFKGHAILLRWSVARTDTVTNYGIAWLWLLVKQPKAALVEQQLHLWCISRTIQSAYNLRFGTQCLAQNLLIIAPFYKTISVCFAYFRTKIKMPPFDVGSSNTLFRNLKNKRSRMMLYPAYGAIRASPELSLLADTTCL